MQIRPMRGLPTLGLMMLLLSFGGCGDKGGGESKEPAAESAAAAPAPAGGEEKLLNIYNWSDYIDEQTIPNFEKETGIKVRYDVFDSNEVLEAKLLAGKTGYDIVVPGANFLARQIQAGVFQKLDKSKIPNYKNLDPEIMKTLAGYDPGNEHAFPWEWGTTGIGYNVKKIKERLGDVPLDSWDVVLKPENIAKLADCGVTFLDAPTEVMASINIYLGHPADSEDPKHLEEAQALMMKLRPHIKYFHSSQYINDLANGETCVALGWSGDVFIARDRAAEAGQGVELAYFIPKEGAEVWFDVVAIPADAPHPDNAHKFLDYFLRPEVSAAVSNFVNYANANAASTPLLNEEVRTDPAINPPPEVKAKLFPNPVHTADFDRLLTRSWTTIKTGQ
jgi:putrescine transport system substrate-binding protein